MNMLTSDHTVTPKPATGPDKGYAANASAIVLGGHVQGLGIIRSLGRKGIPVYLIDDTAASIGRFSRYCTRFFCVPRMKQEEPLLDFLLKLPTSQAIQGGVIFPTHDATVEILSKNKERLSGRYRISTADWRSTELAYNKKLTYKLANKIGIPVPQTYFPTDIDEICQIGRSVSYPTIIKPAVMHKFYDKLKVKAYKANNVNEMIQEIIPGPPHELYSFCCFYKQGVKASCTGQRCRQIPMDFGKATTFVQSVDIPQLRHYGEKLLSEIEYYGLAEVEFKRDRRDGLFKLLEINPRSWKWHTLAIKAGVDMPFLIYSDLVGRSVVDQNLTGRLNVKWVELVSDFYVACGEIIKGNLSLREYLESLTGDVEFAIASREDPWPFIGYMILIPHFLFSR
jgi:predicted ATP-grasp superfamily ATP-dependent carboligase